MHRDVPSRVTAANWLVHRVPRTYRASCGHKLPHLAPTVPVCFLGLCLCLYWQGSNGIMASATVNFSVGGSTYTTIRETILKEPASRLGLLIRGVLPAVRDESGTYFVDRDPRFFQLILNFLRDGWCMLPKTADDRRELLQEVRYFQVGCPTLCQSHGPHAHRQQQSICPVCLSRLAHHPRTVTELHVCSLLASKHGFAPKNCWAIGLMRFPPPPCPPLSSK
jgi:hypothetical protein